MPKSSMSFTLRVRGSKGLDPEPLVLKLQVNASPGQESNSTQVGSQVLPNLHIARLLVDQPQTATHGEHAFQEWLVLRVIAFGRESSSIHVGCT